MDTPPIVRVKKITDETKRQVTYSKRKSGLIKKAYELSVVCDIDIALITFSPSGRVNHFSGKNSPIEDVIARFINLNRQQRPRLHEAKENQILRALTKLKCERDIFNHLASPNNVEPNIEDLLLDIRRHKARLEEALQKKRSIEEEVSPTDSTFDVEKYEKFLEAALQNVHRRKQQLEQNELGATFHNANMQFNMQTQNGLPNGVDTSQHDLCISRVAHGDPLANAHNSMNTLNSNAVFEREAQCMEERLQNGNVYPNFEPASVMQIANESTSADPYISASELQFQLPRAENNNDEVDISKAFEYDSNVKTSGHGQTSYERMAPTMINQQRFLPRDNNPSITSIYQQDGRLSNRSHDCTTQEAAAMNDQFQRNMRYPNCNKSI